MKYTSRFVFYHYDEFDTTLASVYDISAEAGSPTKALEIAQEIVSEQTKIYSSPGETDFVSLTDENGVVYISNLSREGYYGVSLPIPLDGRLVVLPKEDHDKLPKSFCNTGETFFIVDKYRIPKMRFPEMRFPG